MRLKHYPILIILIIASMIRLATIGCGSNVDEGVYWVEGRQIAEGYVIYRDTQFNKTPLVALVAAAFFPLGETPFIPMRIAMTALSVLGLYCLWRLGKNLFGQTAGYAAAVIMALEPFTCLWAKYLHTSTWAPLFETAAYLLLLSGIRQRSSRRIFASGVVVGLYALSKQTAIFMIPPAVAAWLLFCEDKTYRRFLTDGAWWAAGMLLIMGPFLISMLALGALQAMWFDIWTAHHLMAGAFADHTLLFRWHEWKSMIVLAPALWILPIGSAFLFKGTQWKAAAFAWIWLITAALGNILIPTHLWRHYFLVCMPAAALLAGAFGSWLIEKSSENVHQKHRVRLAGCISLSLIMLIGWPKNDWTYPGLSLKKERNLAAHVKRYCREPFLLNLTNPALYVWTGKEIPPAFQGDRITRIPFFMTIAGRGYMTREDIEKTVEYWKTIPIGCVVAYDKFLRQILEDPLMAPLREWLNENFQKPQRVAMGDSYYGWFFIFEKNLEQ
ncbi:MAG: glycosyltransferase family 39 protein [Candidatus Omnitrophica bacterium]|nr:glycosyltransferase family 39 protein [Candidatus Omnitrophota bacterium]